MRASDCQGPGGQGAPRAEVVRRTRTPSRWGRLGAKAGARKVALIRWARIPPEERRALARLAALARWRRPRR
jgi:hypothetical protein